MHSRFDGFWVSQRDHSTTMGPRDLSSTTGLGPTLRLVRNPDIWVLYHLYMAESKNIPSTGAVYIHIYIYVYSIYIIVYCTSCTTYFWLLADGLFMNSWDLFLRFWSDFWQLLSIIYHQLIVRWLYFSQKSGPLKALKSKVIMLL